MRLFVSFILILTFLAGCGNEKKGLRVKMVSAETLPAVLKEYTASNKAVLVNVWATWCGPCVEEFPEIVQLAKKYPDDLDVVFISANFPEESDKVLTFLSEQGVDWPAYVAENADEAFINALDPRWTGAIPVSIFFNRKGEKTYFWEDKASFETFEKALLSSLN